MDHFLKPFLAGFLSTLIFHQGLLALLHLAGILPRPPYDFTPTRPFRVPQVISLAFWGGLWGILIWAIAGQAPTFGAQLLWAIVLGALGPSLVALFIVFPLKGQPFAGGWQPKLIAGVLLVNAAWGAGLALLMRLFGGWGAVPPPS